MMGNHRVQKYECTVHYTSTGSSHTKQYAFTEAQAAEIGTVLQKDGIAILAALSLCERWTKRGQGDSVQYRYRIPLVEYLGTSFSTQ